MMPIEPNDELTFKLTATEAQHIVNVMQQTYQMSQQIVNKIVMQAQTQAMQAQPPMPPPNMRGDGVSDTMPAAE